MLFSVAMVATAPALAAPGDCGNNSLYGRCVGSVLTWCENQGTINERTATRDCATVFPAGTTGECALVSQSYGYDCVAPAAGRCNFVDQAQQQVYALCSGNAPGCVLNEAANTSVCTNGVGPCQAAAAGQSFAPTCVGDVLVFSCQEGQPTGTSCAALGGTCSQGACVNLPAGRDCGPTRSCAQGLTCDQVASVCRDPLDYCQPSTFTPTCSGSSLTYCDGAMGLRTSVDCFNVLGTPGNTTCGPAFHCVDDGVSGACGLLPVACYGAAAGAECSVINGVLCGTGLGCVMGLDAQGRLSEKCQPTANCAFGGTHAGCAGSVATFCVGSQTVTAVEAAGFDCAAFGSSCQVDANTAPYCQGAAGARCDDPTLFPDSPFHCGPGLLCANAGTSFGTCSLPDAGVGDAGGGDDAAPSVDGGTLPDGAVADGSVADAAPSPDGSNPSSDGGGNADAGGGQGGGGGNDSGGTGNGCGCSVDASGGNGPSGLVLSLSLGFLVFFFRRRGHAARVG
jgi:MYXO-CTERM domain-containing protein